MRKLPKAEMTALMALISVGFTCGAVNAADTNLLAADPGAGADSGAAQTAPAAPAKKASGKKHTKKAKGGAAASCGAKKGKEGSCKSGDAGAAK